MGQVHSTFDCVCCADMGVRVRQLAQEASQALQKANKPADGRITMDGLEQVFTADSNPEPENLQVEEANVIEDLVVEPATEVAYLSDPHHDLMAIVNDQAAKLNEQQAKLEAASFRIGFLEAQLETRTEHVKELRLLMDYQKTPVWKKLVRVVQATFAWPPTVEEQKTLWNS